MSQLNRTGSPRLGQPAHQILALKQVNRVLLHPEVDHALISTKELHVADL